MKLSLLAWEGRRGNGGSDNSVAARIELRFGWGTWLLACSCSADDVDDFLIDERLGGSKKVGRSDRGEVWRVCLLRTLALHVALARYLR